MSDLIDATASLVSTSGADPWVTAISILKAVSASLRMAAELEQRPGIAASADWIDSQVKTFKSYNDVPSLLPIRNESST
jgi:hypothetical protein